MFQVSQKDLVLGVLLLELHGVAHLLQLALIPLHALGLDRLESARLQRLVARHRRGVVGGLDRARVALATLDEHVLDVLLADRRPTLRLAARGVAEEGARGSDEVDTAVLVVARVFRREDRVVHDGVDLVERHRRTVLVVELREDLVAGHERRRQHQLVGLQVARHVVEDRDRARRREARNGDRRGHCRGHEDAGGRAQADEADDAAEGTTGRTFVLRHRLDAKRRCWAMPRRRALARVRAHPLAR